jgi:dihydroflavonol-4-reductase
VSGVCVTGASGYVGGAIVAWLLQHTSIPRVHATVRGDVASTRYDALRALDAGSSSKRLWIFSAEVSEPDALDEACAGCQALLHVAAPTTMRFRRKKSAYRMLIDPALRGIENAVRSAEKMGLTTVVLTSSMSAVQGDAWEKDGGKEHVYTADDWNELDVTPERNAYACMKVLSERRCWELFDTRKERNPDTSWEHLVVLCPGFVLGSPSTNVRAETAEFAALLVRGKAWPVMPNYHFSMVHLEDVARAHVLAASCGRTGRYILAAGERTAGLKDVVCGPLKERVEREVGARYVKRFPVMEAPKCVLWVLSWVMLSVQWPLVRAYLNKESRVDGGKVVQDIKGFGAYMDPLDGFVDLLAWAAKQAA